MLWPREMKGTARWSTAMTMVVAGDDAINVLEPGWESPCGTCSRIWIYPVANGASSDDRAGIRNIDVCRLKGKWLFVPEIAICTCLGFSGYC